MVLRGMVYWPHNRGSIEDCSDRLIAGCSLRLSDPHHFGQKLSIQPPYVFDTTEFGAR